MILHFFLIRSTSKNDILPLRNDEIGTKKSKNIHKKTLYKECLKCVFYKIKSSPNYRQHSRNFFV